MSDSATNTNSEIRVGDKVRIARPILRAEHVMKDACTVLVVERFSANGYAVCRKGYGGSWGDLVWINPTSLEKVVAAKDNT